MSSVAIAAGTPEVAADRSEADVVRAAARADRDAFDELYRRHHQVTWRMAQAVGAPEAASSVVADGFSHALRAVRRQRSLAEEPFRPQVLGATYRAGMEPAQAGDATGVTAEAPSAEMAAFRSLPDRWRAALWLSDVEHLSPTAMAAILGVSDAVAGQLADRGRQGLLTRFAQVGVAIPDHLDQVLRPLAGSPPESLEALVAKRWRAAVAVDPGSRLVPVSEWLAQRAPKPLLAACGGLVALGMVGLGVLTVASPPAKTGPAAAISAPNLSSPAPTNPGGGNELFGPGAHGSSAFLGDLGLTSATGTNPILAGEGSSSSLTGTPSALPGTTAGATTPTSGATTSGGTTPGTSGSTGSGSSGIGGSSGTGGGSGTSPANHVTTLPTGAATVTTPASGTAGQGSIAVGSPSNPVANVSNTPTCTGIQVLDIATNKCVNPPTGSTPVSQVGDAVNQTASNVLGSLGG